VSENETQPVDGHGRGEQDEAALEEDAMGELRRRDFVSRPLRGRVLVGEHTDVEAFDLAEDGEQPPHGDSHVPRACQDCPSRAELLSHLRENLHAPPNVVVGDAFRHVPHIK